MLERASSSAAECTAHLFLRSFDKPIRSQRCLGSSFWKHGRDQLAVPIWWPAYLRGIGKSSDTYNVFPRRLATANSKSLLTKPAEASHHDHPSASKSRRQNIRRSLSTKTRSLTVSASASWQSGVESASLGSSEQGTLGQNFPVGHKDRFDGAGSVLTQSSLANPPTNTSPEPKALRSQPSAGVDYKKVWALFVQSGHKQETSSSIFHIMAQSRDRADLINALTAFDSIPLKHRSRADYQIAIDVAIRLKSYRKAITWITQSLSAGFGDDAYFKFMAFCVQHTLWNTLAALWKAVGPVGRMQIKSRQLDARTKSPNMAGKYSFHFDTIPGFPAKIVSLATRLENTDAVLATNREELIQVCKRLSYIAAESPRVMATINSQGVLALFNVQQQLNFDSKLHLAALGAIAKMPERGSLAQLTLLIYRNLCFKYPDLQIPRWVFGVMIGICADGRRPSSTYKYLLAMVKRHYGQVDSWSYQQVLSACARQGDATAVQTIFKDYLRVDQPKDLRDVHPLLHVYAVVGDAEQTWNQFNRLQEEFGLKPNVVSWTILLLAHARSSKPMTAFNIFRMMKSRGVEQNTTSWAIIISVAAKQGDTKKAQRLYDEAKQETGSDSLYFVGPIVDSLLLNHNAQDAENLVIEASRQHRNETSIRLWNSLFRYYAFRSDTRSISRIQNAMQRMGIKPDDMTYGALMTALVVKGQTKNAEKLLRKLHVNHRLHPTEFHYSILIHGYATEGNRDSASVMYNEMLGRFPRASASAKFAMLRLQLRRDSQKLVARTRHNSRRSYLTQDDQTRHLPWHGLQYLARILVDDPSIDAASSLPNPGFGRRSARDGLQAIYFGSLISFLQTNMAHKPSEALIAEAYTSSNLTPLLKTTNMTYDMNVAIQRQDWKRVDYVWDRILKNSLESLAEGRQETGTTKPEAHGISVLSADVEAFKPMLPTPDFKDKARTAVTRILPAHRFALSWPFSMYLQALGYQERYSTITQTVQRFEDLGFSLSSRNWNRYVKVLSKSYELEDRILAFECFETHFFHKSLQWNVIRRGKYIAQAQASLNGIIKAGQLGLRRKLERSDPHLFVPSYFTMVHLAVVVAEAYQAMQAGDTAQMDGLREKAPRTLALIQKVPRLADRAQGLLLRNRNIVGDREARPRAVVKSLDCMDDGEIRSLLDKLPPLTLERFYRVLTIRENIQNSQLDSIPTKTQPSARNSLKTRLLQHIWREEARSGNDEGHTLSEEARLQSEGNNSKNDRKIHAWELQKVQPLIDLAEEAFGEIPRSQQYLPAQGRRETAVEMEIRIMKQQVDYLDIIDKIRKKLKTQSFLSDLRAEEIGEPVFFDKGAAKNLQQRDHSVLLETIRDAIDDLQWRKPISDAEQSWKPRNDSKTAPNIAGTLGQPSRTKTQARPKVTEPKNPAVNYFPMNSASSEGSPAVSPLLPSRSHEILPATHGIALKRRIAPYYEDGSANPPVKPTPRRRGAWSINKANRLRRLREKQLYERWNKKVQKQKTTASTAPHNRMLAGHSASVAFATI